MNDNHQLDMDYIRDLYNNMPEIWPENDKWYTYTHDQIEKYLKKYAEREKISDTMMVLDAGSGGNTYGIPGDHYHIDVAYEKIKHLPNAFLASVEKMPFEDEIFDYCMCVGSVINYCDPYKALDEIRRVLKKDGKLFLDFDQSKSWEFVFTSNFNCNANIIDTFNSGERDRTWVFSVNFIEGILKTLDMKVVKKHYYHSLSPLAYHFTYDDAKAAKYARLDKFIRYIPVLNKISCNTIIEIEK